MDAFFARYRSVNANLQGLGIGYSICPLPQIAPLPPLPHPRICLVLCLSLLPICFLLRICCLLPPCSPAADYCPPTIKSCLCNSRLPVAKMGPLASAGPRSPPSCLCKMLAALAGSVQWLVCLRWCRCYHSSGWLLVTATC